jgi:hypothetical protein
MPLFLWKEGNRIVGGRSQQDATNIIGDLFPEEVWKGVTLTESTTIQTREKLTDEK